MGMVSWRTYFNQFNLTPSWILNILALMLAISVPILNGYLRLFITDWVSVSLEEQDSSYFIWGYIALSLASVVAASLATLSIAFLYLYFSQQLHNKMLKSVTRAPIPCTTQPPHLRHVRLNVVSRVRNVKLHIAAAPLKIRFHLQEEQLLPTE